MSLELTSLTPYDTQHDIFHSNACRNFLNIPNIYTALINGSNLSFFTFLILSLLIVCTGRIFKKNPCMFRCRYTTRSTEHFPLHLINVGRCLWSVSNLMNGLYHLSMTNLLLSIGALDTLRFCIISLIIFRDI